MQLPEERDQVFSTAVEASLNDDPALAAAASHSYLQGATVEDPRYDRALRLLATSAEQLGFTYAASLWYLDIAQARRDVELVDDAVQGLERLMLGRKIDEATIRKGFIATEEITGLGAEQQAFVDYYQALDSVQHGLLEWAQKRFDKIPVDSPYHARSLYVLAVNLLAERKLEEAEEQLLEILEISELPEDLHNSIQRDLARIAFHEKRYKDALAYFDSIRATAPDDPMLLLEMAWAHYYRGESHRALGLLVALDAPAYRDLIAPERFLLEALLLRNLCQFEPARSAAVRLRTRHGGAISDLHNGVPLRESEALKAAARLRTGAAAVSGFRNRVFFELALIEQLSSDLGPQLTKALRVIYAQGIKEGSRRENEELLAEMESLAQELLSAEEGVRLILHELGVALLRGRGRPEGIPDRGVLDFSKLEAPVFYIFEGEFWTDEVDDLVVTIEDRCID